MKLLKKFSCFLLAASMLSIPVSVHADGYYNAIAEVNQIRDFMNRGMYLEAIRDSRNTIAWHNLSPDDISLLNGYIYEAETSYNDYLNGVTAIDKTWNALQGYWFHMNTDYLMEHHSVNLKFNPDGTFYYRTWRIKGYGTYTVTGANTVSVSYDVYFNGAGTWPYDYDGTYSDTYYLSGNTLYGNEGAFEHRNYYTNVSGDE